jgi:UDP-N-acetylmuramoylalanine--D-glutamate ligase
VNLSELCARRVAVWGMGEEGLAITRLLIDRGVTPILIDDDTVAARQRLSEVSAGGDLAVVSPDRMDWDIVDAVVRSPGVSRYRSELLAAEASGVSVTTAMAMWLEDFHHAPVLAVTGTKGKSTTASLAAAILGEIGLEVALVGNIGVPVVDLYDRPPVDAYVVEVSSYQAADVTLSPRVCVLTSLAPDHLDWHGGIEPYYRDKLRLLNAGPPGALAVNADSAEARRRTEDHPHRVLFGHEGTVRAETSGVVTVDGRPLVDSGLLRTPGEHNVTNLCGAIAGVLLLRGEVPAPSVVTAAVDGFDALPSRCRTVGVRHGVTFVDDALASNPFASAASIGAFPDRELTVILGGADRGVGPGPLLEALAAHRPMPRVVVLPPDPQRVVAALRALAERVPIEVAGDIEEAVAIASASTPAGGVVLFSPAAPTPEGEGGYRQRSRRYIAAAGLAEPEAEPGRP